MNKTHRIMYSAVNPFFIQRFQLYTVLNDKFSLCRAGCQQRNTSEHSSPQNHFYTVAASHVIVSRGTACQFVLAV